MHEHLKILVLCHSDFITNNGVIFFCRGQLEHNLTPVITMAGRYNRVLLYSFTFKPDHPFNYSALKVL